MLHITGNEKERKFIVKPSAYVIDHIHSNIKQEYVMTQVEKVFRSTEEMETTDNTINISQSKLKMSMAASK